MSSRMVKRGFTLIELLVVIAIIAILASILFPVFGKARDRARMTQCLSQVRQISMALQMYTQDNQKYPSANWATDMTTYVGSTKMYVCPMDSTKGVTNPVSYGYNAMLVMPNGLAGVPEGAVKQPAQVGAFADAVATSRDAAGLIGAIPSSNFSKRTTEVDQRHGAGVVVGYCDGHAKVSADIDPYDASSSFVRAFYAANALGLVDNPVAGMRNFTKTAGNVSNIVLGGDFAVMPIMVAAADALKTATSNSCGWTWSGFNGSDNINGMANPANSGKSHTWWWGIADGEAVETGSIPVGSRNFEFDEVEVGKDALVMIVSKGCKLRFHDDATGTVYTLPKDDFQGGKNFAINKTWLHTLYTSGKSGARATGYTAYTYSGGDDHGNVRMFMNYVGIDGTDGNRIEKDVKRVKNDYDMVNKVSLDPYGIGFCSSAMVDPEKVSVVGLFTDNADLSAEPTSDDFELFPINGKYSPEPSTDVYPLIRTLKVRFYAGNDPSSPLIALTKEILDRTETTDAGKALAQSPLFYVSYWGRENDL